MVANGEVVHPQLAGIRLTLAVGVHTELHQSVVAGIVGGSQSYGLFAPAGGSVVDVTSVVVPVNQATADEDGVFALGGGSLWHCQQAHECACQQLLVMFDNVHFQL